MSVWAGTGYSCVTDKEQNWNLINSCKLISIDDTMPPNKILKLRKLDSESVSLSKISKSMNLK